MDFNDLIDKKKQDKKVEAFLKNPFENIPSLEEAINISRKYKIDLHPRYIYYWNEISSNEFIIFLEFLKKAKIEFTKDKKIQKIILPKNEEKRHFELLGVEHIVSKVSIEKVKSQEDINIIILNELDSNMFLVNLGLDIYEKIKTIEKDFEKRIEEMIEFTKANLVLSTLEIINKFAFVGIRDKAGTYIGARMGRPEKAKMRKQFNDETRSHGLFPVGLQGGRSKNIIEVLKNTGHVEELFRTFLCEKCNSKTIFSTCEKCKGKTKQLFFEKYTYKELSKEDDETLYYEKRKVDISSIDNDLRLVLGKDVQYPKVVKGISSTINKHHTVEHISKGFLRAINNVFVNKDGTVRYDMIEMGLTHFKPKEIETSIEKLHELGYTKDYLGNELTDVDQLVEILPQDVILPDCAESGDEFASDFVINTGKFVDDLLEKLYGLPRFYNFERKEDTIGHLIIGLAPHTSAGIVGRILGYTKTQGCFSHPVWHAAQRRNLDGDENGVMLLLDGLINFSREYLPDRRGSRSVTEDTVLYIEENGRLRTVKIGEYIDSEFEKGYEIEEDGFETQKVLGLKVFSFNQKTGKVSLENVSKLIRHKCDKEVYEIKTSDGWIKTTQDHSIFALDFMSGEIIEKRAEELKKGDFIVSLGKVKIETPNRNSVKVSELNITQDVRSCKLPEEIILNQSFFRLLGFIYAEGYINGNKIEIGNTNKEIIEKIILDIENILNIKINVLKDKRKDKYTNGIYYRINLPTNFVKVLKKLGVKEQRALEKEIPDLVYRTSKQNIEAFLEGYMIGDGTSYLDDIQRKSIRLYTSSIKIASGLSFLAYLINKKSTCRKSYEKRTNSQKYEIFISEYKLRSSFWSVYHLRKRINEGLKKSGLNLLKRTSLLANINLNKRKKSSSKQKIEKILTKLKLSPENHELIKQLKLILNQDIRLELVNDIKKIDYSGNVYDLEVPQLQNFLCGPHPIFAHNTMDVSLVLTSHLYLDQIDDEVHGMDIVHYYPLEFYQGNKNYISPKAIKIPKLDSRINLEKYDDQYLGYGFTHTTQDLNNTILCSSYKSVPSMAEKLELQLEIGGRIRAVDEHQVGSFVIDKHFMKDIKGNLRKFSMQTFRCTSCNTKFRRPPLIGKCTNCGSQSVNFTIHEGSIKKYIGPSFQIIEKYNVDPYIVESIELVQLRVEGVFGKEVEKQMDLSDFFTK